MKYTKIVENRKSFKNLLCYAQKRSIIFSILYFLLGIFISRATVFDDYNPFGISLISVVPYKNLLFTFLGTGIGYIFQNDVNICIRYIVTILSVILIRWTLNDLKAVKESILYAPFIAGISTLATGIIVNKGESLLSSIFSYNLVEAIFAGVFAYFFKETISLFDSSDIFLIYNQQKLYCTFISLWILILSFSSVYVGPISFGRVMSSFAILFFSRYLGLTGGSVAGISAAVVFGLSSKSPSYIYSAYSFSGMMSGLMCKFGKYFQSFVFLGINIVVSLQSENVFSIISNFYEGLIAVIIFLFLPERYGKIFESFFYCPTNDSTVKTLQKNISNRLSSMSDALFNIGNSIFEVSRRLSKSDDISDDMILKVKENVCRLCGIRTLCWETKVSETVSFFKNINGENSRDNNVFQNVANRCCKINDIKKYINSCCEESNIRNIAQKRILEIKSFVSEQFNYVGKILDDISNECKKIGVFDKEMAEKISSKLRSLNLFPKEVVCMYDSFNRLSVEIEILCKKKDFFKDLDISEVLSKVCHKSLDEPCINFNNDICKVNICEKPKFSVDVGAFQHICKGEALCGDNYTYFNDGRGRMIFILSDGMGTGPKAAIEGALACEMMSSLLKSGIGFETAVKITNSCLFLKSEEESFATVDIVCLDLFTGEIDLIKCGAPVTFFKKNNNVMLLDLPSLPIGILRKINFICRRNILSYDDKILIVSDGAIYPDEKWLKKEMDFWTEEKSESFAQRIVNEAIKKRSDYRDDDITAIAIKFNRL